MRVQISHFWDQPQRRPLPPHLIGPRVPTTGSLCGCVIPLTRVETDGNGGVTLMCLRCGDSHTVERRRAGDLGFFAPPKRSS